MNGGVGHALKEALQDSGNDQESGASLGQGWRQYGQEGCGKNTNQEYSFASISSGQESPGNLGHDVAVEEGSKDDALGTRLPGKVRILQHQNSMQSLSFCITNWRRTTHHHDGARVVRVAAVGSHGHDGHTQVDSQHVNVAKSEKCQASYYVSSLHGSLVPLSRLLSVMIGQVVSFIGQLLTSFFHPLVSS